jgi:hypothetical protein
MWYLAGYCEAKHKYSAPLRWRYVRDEPPTEKDGNPQHKNLVLVEFYDKSVSSMRWYDVAYHDNDGVLLRWCPIPGGKDGGK